MNRLSASGPLPLARVVSVHPAATAIGLRIEGTLVETVKTRLAEAKRGEAPSHHRLHF